MYKLEKTVLDSLEAAAVEAGDVLLAAVSGGADSTALLASLAVLSDVSCRRFRLSALHVNHALRGDESRADAEAVALLCYRLEVPCRVVTAADGLIEREARRGGRGVEAAARDFRHAALRDEADRLGARFILIAHTRNDALENTLLRILRGAGPAGLAAMPERNGRILRPLLTLDRGEICAYLREHGISWREDSSNNDGRYLRNRIRLYLVPLLDEHFPGWRKSIAALAETQALTAEFLSIEAARRIDWDEEPGGRLSCAVSRFAAESQIVREEALFLAYDRVCRGAAGGNEADEPPPPSAAPRRPPLRRLAAKLDGCDLGGALRGGLPPLRGGAEAPKQTVGLLRAVAGGETSTLKKLAQNLGDMDIELKDGRITAAHRKQKPLEECASILINRPGLYRLKNFSIECIAGSGDGEKPGSCRFIVREVKP